MVEYRFVRALVIVYDQYGVLHQSLGSVGASYESARVNVNKSLRLCAAVNIRDTIVYFSRQSEDTIAAFLLPCVIVMLA